jgi:hypothetical protein
MWSHFTSRVVNGLLVPIFSGFTFGLIYWLEGNNFIEFSPSVFPNIAIVATIIGLSVLFLWGARRPYGEAARLELFFLKSKIESDPECFETLVSMLLRREKTCPAKMPT